MQSCLAALNAAQVGLSATSLGDIATKDEQKVFEGKNADMSLFSVSLRGAIAWQQNPDPLHIDAMQRFLDVQPKIVEHSGKAGKAFQKFCADAQASLVETLKSHVLSLVASMHPFLVRFTKHVDAVRKDVSKIKPVDFKKVFALDVVGTPSKEEALDDTKKVMETCALMNTGLKKWWGPDKCFSIRT